MRHTADLPLPVEGIVEGLLQRDPGQLPRKRESASGAVPLSGVDSGEVAEIHEK